MGYTNSLNGGLEYMGLAFRLNTSNYPWFQNLENWLDAAGVAAGTLTNVNTNGTRLKGYGYVGAPVNTGPTVDQGICIAPTGEYIIRDGIYINGVWIVVGSYRCYVSSNGAGVLPTRDGYAWDGFILLHRGYSNINRPVGEITTANLPDPSMYSFIPMRMPLDTLSDPATQWDDPDVGLYSIDFIRYNGEANEVLATQDGLAFWVTGHSNIDPTLYAAYGLAQPPTSLNTCAHISSWYFDPDNLSGRTDRETPLTYTLSQPDSGVFSLYADYFTPQDPTLSQYFSRPYGIEKYVAVTTDAINGVAPPDYSFINFNNGMLPDGSGGGAPGPDRNAVNRGYWPMKAFGVNALGSDNPAILNQGMAYVSGTVGLLNAAGTEIENTCPMMISSIITGDLPTADPSAYYFNMSPAHACPFQAYADPFRKIWFNEITRGSPPATAPYYNLLGANAIFTNPPAENIDPQFAAVQITPIIIGVNNIDVAGVICAGTYTYYSVTGSGDIPVAFVWQVRSGGWETDTGILCPTDWETIGRQYSTFTIPEEDIAFNVTGTTLWDIDHQETVGYAGNWQRLPPNANNSGTPSRLGFGIFGGYSGVTGTGAAAWVYDSTATSGAATATGFNCESILNNIGSDIEAGVIGGVAADFNLISCQWDNDRDQWLMLGSDTTNGVKIISADSIFSTFLDQTANFQGFPATSTSANYTPISMSNSLDGFVSFGRTSTSAIGSRNGTLTTAPTGTANRNLTNTLGNFIYDQSLGTTLPVVRIDGSTGRNAQVWVDYILFDGNDSLIASTLKSWGIKVTVENVEWFKARLLVGGDIKATTEEIENWVEAQGAEYREMLKYKERQGRLRRRRKQVSGYMREIEDKLGPMTIDTEQLADWVPRGSSASLRKRESGGALITPPPTSVEAMVERDTRVGGTPSGNQLPGDIPAEEPGTPAGSDLQTIASPTGSKKEPGESRDPDESLDESYAAESEKSKSESDRS